MADLRQFGATVKKSVTSTAPLAAARFTPNGPDPSLHLYCLTSDAVVYIQRNGDADATGTSAILIANTPYNILLNGTDTLSYVTATTANLWITKLS